MILLSFLLACMTSPEHEVQLPEAVTVDVPEVPSQQALPTAAPAEPAVPAEPPRPPGFSHEWDNGVRYPLRDDAYIVEPEPGSQEFPILVSPDGTVGFICLH